jgi:phospholipid/cholesterol/gamma-HCH transport system substrate-binding protein
VGNAAPFAEDSRALLELLDSQRGAVRRLVRDTGTVFEALGRRQGELSALTTAVDTVLQTTAARNRELEETVRILPTTLRELRPTLAEVEGLAGDAAPVVSALRPSGRALAPALQDAAELAPELRRLFLDIDQVTSVSRTALPAATRTVDAALPLFQQLDPTLAEAAPVVDYLGMFKSEVAATFAGVAAATQGSESTGPGREPVHYLRALVPLTSEGFLVNERRAGSNRHNPYPLPRWLDKLATGLDSIDCSHTGNGGIPHAAPPCRVQEPLEFRGERNAFPHLERDP